MRRFGLILLAAALVALVGSASPPAAVVPAYGTAGYAAPGQHDDVLAELKLLVAEVRGLRADLAARDPNGPKAAQKADPVAAVRAACAGCHTPASAPQKGGGFALFADEGQTLTALSARDRQRSGSRVKSGSMPPPPAKLAPADKAAVVEFFTRGK